MTDKDNDRCKDNDKGKEKDKDKGKDKVKDKDKDKVKDIDKKNQDKIQDQRSVWSNILNELADETTPHSSKSKCRTFGMGNQSAH